MPSIEQRIAEGEFPPIKGGEPSMRCASPSSPVSFKIDFVNMAAFNEYIEMIRRAATLSAENEQLAAEVDKLEHEVEEEIGNRDYREDIIDQLCDAVGIEHEWSSWYQFENAVQDANEKMSLIAAQLAEERKMREGLEARVRGNCCFLVGNCPKPYRNNNCPRKADVEQRAYVACEECWKDYLLTTPKEPA